MRKFIILLVIIAIGVGYSVFWHRQAATFEHMFVDFVNAQNAQTKTLTKDQPLIRYDSVAMTGFPFAMTLEVTKPTFHIPASAFLGYTPNYVNMMKTPPVPFEWFLNAASADMFTLSGNLTGSSYTAELKGDVTLQSVVNGAVRSSQTMTSAPMVCHVTVEPVKGGKFWTMQPIFTDLNTFFDIFRSTDCNMPASEIKDAKSGAVLMTSDGSDMSLNNAQGNGANHKLALTMNLKKFKATPAFDATSSDYLLTYYTLLGKADLMVSPIPASEYGEQNAKVDIRYDGPTHVADINNPQADMHFDINALNFDTALGKLTTEAHFSDIPQGGFRALSLASHVHWNVDERYDQLTQKYLANVLGVMEKSPDTDPVTQSFKKLIPVGTPDQIVAKIYPQFHTLGKMEFDFDFNLKGPNQATALIKQSVIALDDFNLLSDPYGIKVNGKSDASVAGKLPVADITLACIACDGLIHDLGDYAMRAESVIIQMANTPQTPQVTPALVEGVRQFMHGIAEKSDAADLVVHFIMKDAGKFTISGKQLTEVLGLYMTTIAPTLPRPPQQPTMGTPGNGQPPMVMPAPMSAPGASLPRH